LLNKLNINIDPTVAIEENGEDREEEVEI